MGRDALVLVTAGDDSKKEGHRPSPHLGENMRHGHEVIDLSDKDTGAITPLTNAHGVSFFPST